MPIQKLIGKYMLSLKCRQYEETKCKAERKIAQIWWLIFKLMLSKLIHIYPFKSKWSVWARKVKNGSGNNHIK